MIDAPRLVFWELTTACNLKCVHCRACPVEEMPPDDLTTRQSFHLLDQIAELGEPAVVLSGGEPLVRPDWPQIARHGSSLGLRMLLATNGTLLTPEIAREIAECGIMRVSVSIDGATAASHDAFRRLPGSFDAAWRGIEYLKSAGVPFQINTTVSRHNLEELPNILRLAIDGAAAALHIFLLVPTGCGKEMADEDMISPEEYEQVLGWFHDRSQDSPIDLKATCAPHYARIARQKGVGSWVMGDGCGVLEPPDRSFPSNTQHPKSNTNPPTGCLAGQSVCFISHNGEVYPCGYLPVSAGNITTLSFREIWENAEVFNILRNPDNLRGKCGKCEFRRVCMGCRARAYGLTGDYLGPEPYCIYEPRGLT